MIGLSSPTPCGSLTSHVIRDLFYFRALIPSFCLSIKERHDAPLLSLCSDGKKSDLALYVYEFLLFLSAPCGGCLLNLTVDLLMLPAAACECQKASSAHHRSLHLQGWHKRPVSAYS